MVALEAAIDKLNIINNRYNELSEKLSDINVINNQKQFKEFSIELSNIEPIVDAYRRYISLNKQIEEADEIITSEKDPELFNLAKEEINLLTTKIEEITVELKKLLIPPVQDASKNIIVEIRAGTGGDEAALFAGDLFKMYIKYTEKKNWKVDIISSSETGLGGYKEITFSITGKNVYDNLRFEYGGHRVQRIPATESGGRIHTSAVTVAVLPEAEEADVVLRQEDLKIDVFRSGGAGGQNVNKVESAVRITHLPTGTVVQCQDNRSQLQNKASALKVLRSRIYDMQQQEKERERASMRKEQVGSGDRSQKVRTYNYPQNRVTDHRINLTLYKLDQFMVGDLEEMIEALKLHDAEQRMQEV